MAKSTVSAKSKRNTRTTSAAKKASPKSRKSTSRPASSASKSDKASAPAVTIDRRRKADRREAVAVAKPEVQMERRKKVQRRRQIDPTTCERDYSIQEVEFMNAMDEYKRKNGRMFPTCSEVLEVIRDLGYVQLSSSELAAQRDLEPQVEAQMEEESLEEAELF